MRENLEGVVDFGYCFGEFGAEPFDLALRELSGLFNKWGLLPQPLTRRGRRSRSCCRLRPFFVEFLSVEDVVACGCGEHDAYAYSASAP